METGGGVKTRSKARFQVPGVGCQVLGVGFGSRVRRLRKRHP